MLTSKLEVFNTGVSSPVLDMEPYLVAIVISAWECNYPLTIGECTLIAHKLVEGTVFAENIIKFKKELSQHDPDAPLLGSAWWKASKKGTFQLLRENSAENLPTYVLLIMHIFPY